MESLNNAPAPTMSLTIIDIYPQNLEEDFHNINEMHSIKVLMNEVDVCDLIIEYKKKKNRKLNLPPKISIKNSQKKNKIFLL